MKYRLPYTLYKLINFNSINWPNLEKSVKGRPQKKKKKGSDDEGLEDSDDGDEEGRELDYISDTSVCVP